MTLTQEDRRDKIRSQLVFELTHPELPKKRADKSIRCLCKRARFLQNPNNKRDPNEKREYSYKW